MIGQILMVTGNTVTQAVMSSPNYPGMYTNEIHCRWTVQVERPLLVQLSFLEFDLEQG